MNLFIDIGNTSLHWRKSDGLETASPTISVRHKNDWESALKTLETTLGDSSIARVIIASVAGEDAGTYLEAWVKQRFSIQAIFVGSRKESCGVVNAYDDPAKLGVDRWLALLAGHQYINEQNYAAALIVDAGTAMTLDAVLSNGSHLGGNIMAGLELQQSTLLRHTHEIKASGGDASVWGKNTASAVANGACFALFGAVSLAFEQLQLRLGERAKVHLLLTGGDAEVLEQFFSERSGFNYSVHSNLVLDGLEVYSTN